MTSTLHQLLIARIEALLQSQPAKPILPGGEGWGEGTLTEEERTLADRFNRLVSHLHEAREFVDALGSGRLDYQCSRGNLLTSPLKQLHANLRHVVWQTKQVAQGDLSQEVDFLGDFADSFNLMIQSLREKAIAEENLTKSEQQYRIIFDKSPLGMAHISVYGEILLVNPALVRLLEYPEESLLEMRLADILPDDHLQDTRELLDQMLQGKTDSIFHEIQCLTRSKKLVWVQVNSTIIRDPNRSTPYVLSIIQNIHQQKQFEQQIRNHNRLLESLVESRTFELTEAKDRAEKADRVKSEFLANMSHEMRTPINGIIGIAELGINREMKREEAFVGILHESQALLSLVNGILDLSKIEADQVKIESIPFSLDTILDDLFTYFEPIAMKKKISLKIQISDKLPARVLGDPLRLRQVLINLLENAIKFTHEGGVTVRITPLFQDEVHCHMHFVVDDTGIGISEEEQKTIFRHFTQVDSKDTRKYGGAGLGLSIAQRLLQLMGAEICVQSKPGKGSSFSFDIEMRIPSSHRPVQEWTAPMIMETKLKLPEVEAFDAEQNDETPSTALSEKAASDMQTDSKTRVLVVEDYEANWMILMGHLKHLGYHSELAKNGKEAVACFRENRFDLVLMDIQMPEMNGLDATRIIREIERDRSENERVPIIAVTANTTEDDRQNCFDAGMDDFLTKPLTRETLFEKLARWLAVGQDLS